MRFPASVLCLVLCVGLAAQDTAREEDHARLRELLAAVTAALNDQDLEALGDCVAPTFSVTFADQRRFTDLAAIGAYRDALQRDHDIAAIRFAPEVDERTVFIAPDIGLATGSSTDTFTLASGDSTTITSRWTATVQRDGDRWRLAALHAGVDLLDNPILDRTRNMARNLGIIGLVLGLLLGGGGAFFLARRRSRPTP